MSVLWPQRPTPGEYGIADLCINGLPHCFCDGFLKYSLLVFMLPKGTYVIYSILVTEFDISSAPPLLTLTFHQELLIWARITQRMVCMHECV